MSHLTGRTNVTAHLLGTRGAGPVLPSGQNVAQASNDLAEAHDRRAERKDHDRRKRERRRDEHREPAEDVAQDAFLLDRLGEQAGEPAVRARRDAGVVLEVVGGVDDGALGLDGLRERGRADEARAPAAQTADGRDEQLDGCPLEERGAADLGGV